MKKNKESMKERAKIQEQKRLEIQANVKKRHASPQPNETFKPIISKKSQQMMENRAGKKIEDHLLEAGAKAKAKQ